LHTIGGLVPLIDTCGRCALNKPIALYEIWLLSRQRHCFSSHSCVPVYTIFTVEQSEMTLFCHLFKAQYSGFPRRRFTPNLFDIQKASVFTNPRKSGGGDVLKDLRKGLPAQGETGFFETSISSRAGSKEKTNDPISRRAMVRGSRGAGCGKRT